MCVATTCTALLILANGVYVHCWSTPTKLTTRSSFVMSHGENGMRRQSDLMPLELQAAKPFFSFTLIAASATMMAAVASSSRAKRHRQYSRRASVLVQCSRTESPVLTPSAMEFSTLCDPSELPESMRRRFEAVCAEAQVEICNAIEAVDGKGRFSHDHYTRSSGPGGGISCVLTDGNVFEKAGVNLSVVYSAMPQEALQAATSRGVDRVKTKLVPGEKVPFFACGISSVMHPKNPHCPTMHFNYRYFETAPLPREDGTQSQGVWWFGGGTDITPSYVDVDDMKHFHGTYKDVCDRHNPEWYPRFKEWADTYFSIQHRGETRGLGGIFFDDFNDESPETHLQFSKDCLKAVPTAYVPILEKNKDHEFNEEQKNWQQMRRGRYVEFNLVYDRGTVFGLKMLLGGVGRIESILMSLPETARWQYCHEPEHGTPEADLIDACKTPREWC